MLDPPGPPGHGVGQRDGGLALRIVGHAVALLGDELAEYRGVETLGQAVIHRLVEEFVYDDEVIPDRLLVERREVILEEGRQLIKVG